jgi:ArsR family metal-binding transcriptional regulator
VKADRTEPRKLLISYRKEIFRPACNPEFQSLHCIAHLDQDISAVLPYLNAVLGGFEFLKDPPAVVFKVHGKLITVHGHQIALNALKDEAEVDKILEWLKREINSAWEERENIEPSYTGAPKPKIIEILRLLPQTNCRRCGQPTCLVFATRLAEGIYSIDQCPILENIQSQRLTDYLSGFHFD